MLRVLEPFIGSQDVRHLRFEAFFLSSCSLCLSSYLLDSWFLFPKCSCNQGRKHSPRYLNYTKRCFASWSNPKPKHNGHGCELRKTLLPNPILVLMMTQFGCEIFEKSLSQRKLASRSFVLSIIKILHFHW